MNIAQFTDSIVYSGGYRVYGGWANAEKTSISICLKHSQESSSSNIYENIILSTSFANLSSTVINSFFGESKD